jgi:hypothetical protein
VIPTPRRFDVVGAVEGQWAPAPPICQVIPMIGLDDVVQILRYAQRELLVVVHVDHGSLAERPIQPHAHRAVNVLVAAWPQVLVFVSFVLVAQHDAHVYVVVSLVDDDLANVGFRWGTAAPTSRTTRHGPPRQGSVTQAILRHG